MRRWLGPAVAAALLIGAGCGAARDLKDAADGLKNAERDTKELEARLARARDLTFTATYEVKSKDGKTEEIVLAQKPPKSSYGQGDTRLIDDGDTVVSCSKRNGKDECVELGPHTDAGIFGIGGGFNFAFNPATFVGLYTTAAIVPGVEAGKSTRDIAGQKSECVSIKVTRGSDAGQGFEGCTSDDGIFTYSDDGDGNVVTLKRFEKRADDADFTPPAKVRTQQDVIDDATSTTVRSGPSRSSTSSSSTSTSTTEPTTTSTTEPNTSDPPTSITA